MSTAALARVAVVCLAIALTLSVSGRVLWGQGAALASASASSSQGATLHASGSAQERVLAGAARAATGVLRIAVQVPPKVGRPSRWEWPVAGREVLVRPFDRPPRPWLAGHRGVDLATAPQGGVRAVARGSVRFSGTVAGVGVISLRHHDGLVSTYQPVDASVRRGDQVARGQMVGRQLGSRGHCAPSACLHLGARHDGEYVDPMLLLGDWEVSLLPLGDRDIQH
ncbi:MAG: M23 family metallopeptidase [Ornithinimicrobium sp.]